MKKELYKTLCDFSKTAIGAALVIALVLAVLALIPLVTIWCINVIGEYSTGFYIDHNPWTYLATLILVGLVRGKVEWTH